MWGYEEVRVNQTVDNLQMRSACRFKLILIHICMHIPRLAQTWQHQNTLLGSGMNGNMKEDALCKSLLFVKNLLPAL